MPPCDVAVPASCVKLNLKGVVVTAIDTFGGKTGDFWVQEPDGGPFSGIQVFGAPLDQVAALQIGDIVDISARRSTSSRSRPTPRATSSPSSSLSTAAS